MPEPRSLFPFRFWRSGDGTITSSWHMRCRIRRIEIGYGVHRHRSGFEDRWVVHPHLVYDRRPS